MASNLSVRVNAVYKQYVHKKKNNTVSEWIFWWKINPVHLNLSLCCFILLLIQIADADLRVSDINTAYIGRVLWNMSSDVWVPLEDVTSRQMSNNPATANSAEREKERERAETAAKVAAFYTGLSWKCLPPKNFKLIET